MTAPQYHPRYYYFLTPLAYNPQEFQKLDQTQNTTEMFLAGMICHLVVKAVMQHTCIKMLT